MAKFLITIGQTVQLRRRWVRVSQEEVGLQKGPWRRSMPKRDLYTLFY